MHFFIDHDDVEFPHPEIPNGNGGDNLFWVPGGDLKPEMLLLGYRHGFFPWYSYKQEDLYWCCPKERFVIPVEKVHVSHSMRTLINKNRFTVTWDKSFRDVMVKCATVDGRNNDDRAWLGPHIIRVYLRLHEMGFAHSVEVWDGERLVGGLYGVRCGTGFVGESMFSEESGTSKLALISLARRLEQEGGTIIDCQVRTEHLESMGGTYMSYAEYINTLYGEGAYQPWQRRPFLRWDDSVDPQLLTPHAAHQVSRHERTSIAFHKMHGNGNDYIFVDLDTCKIDDPASLARLLSDRHKGVGGDGLVTFRCKDHTSFEMNIYNADGSRGHMCGNACMCLGKLLYDYDYTIGLKDLILDTDSGSVYVEAKTNERGEVTQVKVGMMYSAVFEDPKLFNGPDDTLPPGVFVSMGNPHYVIFVDDLEQIDVAALGSSLERHRAFPRGCNIEFARVLPESDTIDMRVWERGSGITMACGTGACATMAAAVKTKRVTPHNTQRLRMPGGEVLVNCINYCMTMIGTPTYVFTGVIDVS